MSKRHLFRTAFFAITLLAGCSSEEHAQSVQLRVITNPEIKEVVEAWRGEFLASQPKISSKIAVGLKIETEIGQSVATKISSGGLKPHFWIAPGSGIVQLTNSVKEGINTIFESCPLLFASPVVVASTAEVILQLGDIVEGSTISLQKLISPTGRATTVLDIADLDGAPSGLAILNQIAALAARPSDKFPPDIGLDSIKELKLQLGRRIRREDLLLKSVASPAKFEQPRYLQRLALTTEYQVYRHNSLYGSSTAPLTPLFPKEGSSWIKYLGCSATGEWMNSYEKAALKMWQEFVSAKLKLLETEGISGLRNADGRARVGSSSLEKIPNDPIDEISGDEITRINQLWRATPHGDEIILLIDTWRTMNVTTMATLAAALTGVVEEIPSDKKIALIVNKSSPILALPAGNERKAIPNIISGLSGEFGESLFPALDFAVGETIPLSPSRKTIVVITDGDRGLGGRGFSSSKNDTAQRIINDDALLIIANYDDKKSDDSTLKALVSETNGVYARSDIKKLPSIIAQSLERSY